MEKLKQIEEIHSAGIHGLKAELIERTDTKAIYLRSDGYYEYFYITVLPEGEVFGKLYPERECYPSNESFGNNAWTCKSYEKAIN